MRAPGVRRREIFGFCMFDFANSSYTTLITTVAFALYFKEVVVGGGKYGDFLWSVARATGMAILIVTSPVMGALADFSGRKKTFLLVTSIQTIAATALLYFTGPGTVLLAVALYVVGTVGFDGGYVFYNAFLPEIAKPKSMNSVSGLSWGTGFLGGLTALIACSPLLKQEFAAPDGSLIPEALASWRLSFVVVAAFFAVFAVPTFAFLKDRGVRPAPGELPTPGEFVSIGFRRVIDTFRHVRKLRDVATYVVAAFFFYGSIQTVIAFSALYARGTLGMETSELLLLLIVANLAAVPGTLLAGWLADRLGMKNTLVGTLLFWFALLIFGATIRDKTLFWAMSIGVAIGMGSTQAIGRALMARISPRSRESEFQGFYILAGQLGSVATLLLFGIVSSFFGGQRGAVLATAPFFLIATVLVARMNVHRAVDEAARYTPEELAEPS